jgi:hypothetical protein
MRIDLPTRRSCVAFRCDIDCTISCLHGDSATASVQELRPSALRSELAFRARWVSDSSPLVNSGSLSKNFLSWQHGYAVTWEQRTFEAVTKLVSAATREADKTLAELDWDCGLVAKS